MGTAPLVFPICLAMSVHECFLSRLCAPLCGRIEPTLLWERRGPRPYTGASSRPRGVAVAWCDSGCGCCCRRVPDPVTDAERASAARIRMVVDRKRGVKTPAWIVALAGEQAR